MMQSESPSGKLKAVRPASGLVFVQSISVLVTELKFQGFWSRLSDSVVKLTEQ
jgi:hypothetical protein